MRRVAQAFFLSLQCQQGETHLYLGVKVCVSAKSSDNDHDQIDGDHTEGRRLRRIRVTPPRRARAHQHRQDAASHRQVGFSRSPALLIFDAVLMQITLQLP